MSALNATPAVPPAQPYVERGYGASSGPHPQPTITSSAATDFGSAPSGNPSELSPLSQSVVQPGLGRFNEEWDASQRGSSIVDGPQRSNSVMSQGDTLLPSRAGTLRKKTSVRRGPSLRRSASRRSSRAGSVRSLALQPTGDIDEMQSAFYSPVPTSGNPTEILANRFQAWRKVLKDLIAYFREMQAYSDHKAKNLAKISNVLNNTTMPPVFLTGGVIDNAVQILQNHHKLAIAESNKSRDIENDVILALVGLRSDLSQKIKEIKNLSGDFKSSLDKEMESTRKAVDHLQDALGHSDIDPSQMTGKQDPYLLKLAVDRQVEKQLDEENYLHQAYLNLEASGRELEAIVVGEIQKSYNAYAGILKREADTAYAAVEELRAGPIAMPKDFEWNAFVEKDEHFIDPKIPIRRAQNIAYPGRDNELAQEVRAGLLERKSKYLKSYTAGWYVLSPTHLHEFKSADKTQAPIMSLYLPEQKLGSHSPEGSSSNKFMLKGRQTGALHRGHSWVFRAESWDTMQAWVSDIEALTEKTPQERSAFVRQHVRVASGTSHKPSSISSDGIMDEEDEEPFSAAASSIVAQGSNKGVLPRRPEPGGRFPSDLKVDVARGLQAPLSPSSGSSGFGEVKDPDLIAAAGAIPGSGVGSHYGEDMSPTHAALVDQYTKEDGINPYTGEATAGLGTAGGAAGLKAYHKQSNFNNRGGPSPQEGQAAPGPSSIAALTSSQQERQAALEATVITADDTLTSPPATSDSKLMSGGRSIGDLSLLDKDVESEAHPKPTTIGYQTQSVPKPIAEDEARPALDKGQSNGSAQTISQLHVPGEFPRGGS